MKRKKFITYLISSFFGVGLISVIIEACRKQELAPTNVDFTLDLTDPANKDLNNNGGFIYKNGIVVAKTKAGVFIALSQKCTHLGCTVSFDGSSNFICPCHGAQFDSQGNATAGPTPLPLTKYNTLLSGSKLHIFS